MWPVAKAGSSCLSCITGQAWSGNQLLTPQGPIDRGNWAPSRSPVKVPRAESGWPLTPSSRETLQSTHSSWFPQSWKAGTHPSSRQPVCPSTSQPPVALSPSLHAGYSRPPCPSPGSSCSMVTMGCQLGVSGSSLKVAGVWGQERSS